MAGITGRNCGKDFQNTGTTATFRVWPEDVVAFRERGMVPPGQARGLLVRSSRYSLVSFSSVFSAGFSLARFSAVPRMSPSVAPESEEPY
ncbi:MAG: hypothetical protein QOG83_3259 [Alphaproteobacteria bacterium]|nr:hypothetical protein [Alphaproteobacteria bacterium]